MFESIREATAEPCEYQKGTQDHRDRIKGMAEKQCEPLDKGDLDEQEGEAEGKEIYDQACRTFAVDLGPFSAP